MASTTTIETEVRGLEQQYWEALRDGDVGTLLRLTDDPCVVTGAQGAATVDHKAYAAMMEAPTWKLNDFEITDVVTRAVTDDVVVIGYKVREEMTVDGKPLTLEAADASTWVRRGDGWVCSLHTESALGDPFGRDRAR
jgi:hypothetical protein